MHTKKKDFLYEKESYLIRGSCFKVWNYLEGSNYKLGFLINFGDKLEIKRRVYDKARKRSALSSRISVDQRKYLRVSAGVTLIELLLVMGIIAILAATTTPFLTSFILRNNLETTTDKVIGTVRKAQNYALDGKNDATWGVCLANNNLRLFSGSCTSPTFSENFTIPASVNINGLNETTFSKLRGEPSNALNITINTNVDFHAVQVNEGGGMDVN